MVTSVPWQLRSSQDRDLDRLDRDLSRAPARGPRTRPAASRPAWPPHRASRRRPDSADVTVDDLVEGDRVEVTVGAPAHGGHCVARIGGPHGRVVFVRHALPGERVTAEITELHKGYLRGRRGRDPRGRRRTGSSRRARTPSPGGCGGCDLQHVARGRAAAVEGRRRARSSSAGWPG